MSYLSLHADCMSDGLGQLFQSRALGLFDIGCFKFLFFSVTKRLFQSPYL